MDYPPIRDYAAIGNCHTVALVSRYGSIEWWCPMRFDNPSVFAAILDRERGGRFQIHPTQPYRSTHRYLGDTNVLETTFISDSGTVSITDFMPLGVGGNSLRPHHSILRKIQCTSGVVDLEIRYDPRFDYGRFTPEIRERRNGGYYCSYRNEALVLRTDLLLERLPERGGVVARIRLHEGETRYAGLSFSRGEPLIIPVAGQPAEKLLHETLDWWTSWSNQCTYEGPYREAVIRSALALKLLTYAPSGAIVAAATTSLPEESGGVRNWDYRYCWIRDASLAIRALMDIGFENEAAGFFNWLLHATHLTWPRLRVLYDVFGGSTPKEMELEHLEGYRGSRPVRVGNGAADQLQLDVYGEIIGAAHEFIMRGGRLGKARTRSLKKLGKVVSRLWSEPDSGLWEVRSGPYHHVYSKVMCFRVLDSLLTMHEHQHLSVPVEKFKKKREEILSSIESEGYDETIRSYTQTYGTRTPDASLLLLPMQRYLDAGAPRMRSTFEYLEKHLSRNGLWYRYPPEMNDGLPGGEASFGACTFWAVEHLALRGDRTEATELFEKALSYANDVGLFAEEIDVETGDALGNFPQAFTHIGLINAALALFKQDMHHEADKQAVAPLIQNRR